MPVKKDENGRRYVEARVEVPGSPEAVWNAIATGGGVSSWFVPSTVEEREGGAVVNDFGPGMESVAKITKWNPPQGFTAETEEGPGKVATEWTVEARAGGTCVVRVVHRWFASTDDWDAQFEGHTYGWAAFFRILRQYLAHFAGQACAAVPLSVLTRAAPQEAWRTLMSGLSIDGGARRAVSAAGAPELSGSVESHLEAHPELLLRLDRPGPGLVHMFVMPVCGPTMVLMRFYFYGDRAGAAAEGAQREWGAWLAERFPREVAQ